MTFASIAAVHHRVYHPWFGMHSTYDWWVITKLGTPAIFGTSPKYIYIYLFIYLFIHSFIFYAFIYVCIYKNTLKKCLYIDFLIYKIYNTYHM